MSREPRSSSGTPRACSAMNAAVFHQALPRSARALAPSPCGMTLRLSPRQVRSGGRPAASTGALALSRRRTRPPVSVVPLISRPEMLSSRFIAAFARSGDVKPGHVGDGDRQPRAHRQPEACEGLELDATRAQRALVEPAGEPAAERDEADVVDRLRPGGRAHAPPPDPDTRRSSSSSSSLRVMPMVSRSSWCRCIHTVWYESMSGDASQASSPSSSFASASVSFAR